jgi:lipopolysaccharide transport system ATP-binding protein
MTVRLGFAVAAFLEPEILVVDEVLAVGDAEFQKKAIGKMQNISHGDGRTVLFVSHNMTSLRQLCSKGFLLINGSISYSGEIGDTITTYLESSLPHNTLFSESITSKQSYLKIKNLEINDQVGNPIILHHSNNSIEIKIEGEINIPAKIGLEIRIYDKNQSPLAFYSPCHYKGYTPDYNAGEFSIRETLMLPKEINKGIYFLSLFLTDPGVITHLAMENAITIEIEGFPTKTGHVFEYDRGAGFLFLK